MFRPVDWSNVEYTTDVDDLTILDRMTFATVAFQFPAGVRFPSLSCDGGDYGLVYPHAGTTTATGAELFVARSQGATFKVHAGVRLNWRDAAAERPFVAFAATTSTIRARHPKGSPLEKLAKTAANAGYGKTSQGIAGLQWQPKHRKLFKLSAPEDTRTSNAQRSVRRMSPPTRLAWSGHCCRKSCRASRSCVGDHRRNRRSVVRCGG